MSRMISEPRSLPHSLYPIQLDDVTCRRLVHALGNPNNNSAHNTYVYYTLLLDTHTPNSGQ